MGDLRFDRIDEYIFAPFNTFVYLDDDLMLPRMRAIQEKLVTELNLKTASIKYRGLSIEWCLEDSEEFKISKGVFHPPGTENSFVMARVVDGESAMVGIPIKEEVTDLYESNSLNFSDIKIYFYNCGVGTCSVLVKLEKRLSILQLEQVSESINNLYKEYFEDLCFRLTQSYVRAIRSLDIPRYHLAYLPEVEDVEKSKHFIPYTHRVYHIEDASLFELEKPGQPFKFLLTPSRRMDVKDLSIYDNRFVYFGWGHSIIFTTGQMDGYSQTSRPVYEYVRLVEIAQAKWQFLDILKDIVAFTASSFNRNCQRLGRHELQTAIDEVRGFRNGVNRILSDFRGVKITFDTEKRVLLAELHERWLTDSLLRNLQGDLDSIEELLDQLYQRQKEQREEALNTIALLFTIVGIIGIITTFIDILEPTAPVLFQNPIAQFALIAFGTFATAIGIILYLRRSGGG